MESHFIFDHFQPFTDHFYWLSLGLKKRLYPYLPPVVLLNPNRGAVLMLNLYLINVT